MNSNEYEEVFEFLSYMNKRDVMKIPEEILLYIKNNRNSKYKTKLNKDDLFNFENLSENALNFLIYIDNTFWKEQGNVANNTIDLNLNKLPIRQPLNNNIFKKMLNKIKKIFKN